MGMWRQYNGILLAGKISLTHWLGFISTQYNNRQNNIKIKQKIKTVDDGRKVRCHNYIILSPVKWKLRTTFILIFYFFFFFRRRNANGRRPDRDVKSLVVWRPEYFRTNPLASYRVLQIERCRPDRNRTRRPTGIRQLEAKRDSLRRNRMIYQSRRKWGDPWKTCVNESDFVPNYF